ncbi:MAG: amidase, partial [Planctomycetota bacterium]
MNGPLDAYRIAALCRAGKLTPLEVAEIHLARTRAAEKKIDAFLSLDEHNVLAQAKSLTSSGPPPGGAGLLFGVPVAIKDNICVQGYPCTCGSKILRRFRPVFHATAVNRIMAEGGMIFGKTNMDEFGMGSSTEFSSIKPTKNPWDPNRSPGGSSGGSAAAVAACVVPLALGT